MKTRVDYCPRCAGDHGMIEAIPLPGESLLAWCPNCHCQHGFPSYAICPTTGAPILLAIDANSPPPDHLPTRT